MLSAKLVHFTFSFADQQVGASLVCLFDNPVRRSRNGVGERRDNQGVVFQGLKVIDLIDFRFRIPGDQPRTLPRGGTEPTPPQGRYTAWWHTDKDTIDQVAPDSLAFVGNLVWRALPRIEQKFYGSQ